MHAFVTGLLCLLLGADQASGPSSTSKTLLILSSHPEVNSSELQLESSAANEVSIPLFLRQTGETAITDVRLVGQLTAQGGGPVPQVRFEAVTNTAAMAPWSVPPKGKQWLLNMKVSGLTADGRYVGAVYVDQAGTLQQLAKVTVERLPRPELAVVGTEANKKPLTVTSPIATVAFPVQIESRNLAPVRDLKLVAARFIDSEGRSVTPRWIVGGAPLSEQDYAVSPRGVLNLQVQAEFPIPGTYKSTLSLSYGNRQESLELVVKRERVVLPVEIKGPVRADAVLGWGGHHPTVWLALQETSGKQTVVNPPQVALLTAKSTAQNRQVDFRKVTVRGDDDQEISTDITLKAGELKRLKLELLDVTEPGELTALIRVTAADHAPLDHTVTLLTKRSICCAIFWIGLGVAISWWLRYYRQDLRPRLQAQERVARLRLALKVLSNRNASLLDADAKRILDEYRGRMGEIDQQLRDGGSTDIDSRVVLIEQKLPVFQKWLTARQKTSGVEPAAIREELDTELDKIRDMLGEDDSDATKLKESVTWMDRLDSLIESKVRGELQRQIGVFAGQVQRASLADDVRRSALRIADEAQELLKQPGKLQEAFDKMILARRELLTQAIQAWNDSVQAVPPPPGFTADEWDTFRPRIAEELRKIEARAGEHLDFAITDCQRVLHDYYQEFVKRLSKAAKKLEQEITDAALEKLSDEKKLKLKADLQTNVLQPLSQDSLKADFEAQRYAAIVEMYEQCAAGLRQVESAFRTLMGGANQSLVSMLSVARTHQPNAVPFLAWSGLGGIRLGGSMPEIHTEPTVAELVRRAKLFYWWTQLLVAAVAVLLGTQWIWANTPTWGTWSDYVTALLLGLGVHQVGDKKLDLDSLLVPKVGG